MHKTQILILDLGSQYTQLIARELLKLGFKSHIVKPEKALEYIELHIPKGIILSGGAAGVYDDNSPTIPDEIFLLDIPVLGICFGMQYIAFRENKSLVTAADKSAKEYGPIEITLSESDLFKDLPKTLKVWASHGDVVSGIPHGFKEIARSKSAIEGIENVERKIYAVQFHPEVIETEDNNQILKNFTRICQCEIDWESQDIVKEIQEEVLRELGNGKAAIGVSGGVDSTTLAALLSPVLKDRLFAFYIDTGGMRMNEADEVKESCKNAGIDLHIIDASREFFKNLEGVTDAEEKRKLFKETYAPIFKKVIAENNITHILQGTLATDLIESGSSGNAEKIKSHHNVGLDFGVSELTPFSKLFKHEIRDIARTLKLGAEISERKPFPGPGLFIRVVGTPVTEELVEKVRIADDIVAQILKKTELYKEASQIVVALLGAKTVGVQGDGRTYNYPIVIRVISSTDFMTVRGMEIPSDIRKEIISEITKHGFNRVFFDETPKPPATTELE